MDFWIPLFIIPLIDNTYPLWFPSIVLFENFISNSFDLKENTIIPRAKSFLPYSITTLIASKELGGEFNYHFLIFIAYFLSHIG